MSHASLSDQSGMNKVILSLGMNALVDGCQVDSVVLDENRVGMGSLRAGVTLPLFYLVSV